MIGSLKSSHSGTAILMWLAAIAAAGCTPSVERPRGDDANARLEATRVKSTDEFVARTGASIDPATHPGNALFAENCATCHSGRVPKAPAVVWLEMMAPDALLASMNDGLMSAQAAHLSDTERKQIAEYLTRTALEDFKPPPAPPACSGDAAKFEGAAPAAVSWGS